jgi:type VI secretion system secreted protein Hcp
MRVRIRVALLAGMLALVLVPTQASASVDMFLDLGPTYQGESNDDTYANTIDVLAFSWGVSKAKDKPANFQDLSFTKYVDRSSPSLMLATASGSTIPTAKLIVRKGGAEPWVYLRYCFTGVRISAVSTGGSGGEDRLTENITFGYQTVVQSYTQQAADGGAGAVFFKGWDLAKNLQYGTACNNT